MILENYLSRKSPADWEAALNELADSIHEVDRDATRIWFYFYPLALHRALRAAPDAAGLARELGLEGDYKLEDQIDSSHHFLYGHRFWVEVKRAVIRAAADGNTSPNARLVHLIQVILAQVAAQTNQEPSLLTGITAVALMTLAQTNFKRFSAAPGTIQISRNELRKSPEDVLRERARDDSQGLLGFLRTTDKRWTVIFDESRPDYRFKCMNEEEIASGAARDRRDWHELDSRCTEGPIPVQCRAAACGTCWVGVLGGREKLSPVSRLEGTKIKEFGYINTNEPQPLIRLACMAQARGAISIVIPPWNGFFGKHLRAQTQSKQPEV